MRLQFKDTGIVLSNMKVIQSLVAYVIIGTFFFILLEFINAFAHYKTREKLGETGQGKILFVLLLEVSKLGEQVTTCSNTVNCFLPIELLAFKSNGGFGLYVLVTYVFQYLFQLRGAHSRAPRDTIAYR